VDIWDLLFEIVVLLGGCLLLGGVFSRLGQSPLVGYLLAGMMLGGPGSFNVVQSEKNIEIIAELGVSMLLFSLGLEFSLTRLKELGARTLLGGILQVFLTTILGASAGLLVGLTVAEAVAVGAMVPLSSTAIVLRVLMERAELDTGHGRNCLGVLLVQDMAVVPLALLMTLLAGGGSTQDVAMNVSRILGMAAGLVLTLYLLLNKIAVYALGTLTLERNRELTVLLSVVTGLGAAFAAHAAGISPALGAFVAGMFLGSSPFATQIRADISSLRVVLLTLFFGAAGMVADPSWILEHLSLVLSITALLTVGKSVIVWGIFRALRHPPAVAAATGICLAQIGEFAFVLASVGYTSGVLTEHIYLLLVSVAIVSLFFSPFLVPIAPWLGARLAVLRGSKNSLVMAKVTAAHPPEIVIIGFGPAGQVAAQAFADRPERVLIIDLNRDGVRKAQELGFRGHIGDVTQVDILEHAQVAAAKAVVITIPHHRSALTMLEHVRRLAPGAHCVVRSRYQRHTHKFLMAGAHEVFGDEEQLGNSLGIHLKTWLTSQRQNGEESP
jgi:CPA2 family monovalent cation:H+ antiporter-2